MVTGWLSELHYQYFADHAWMIITAVLAVLLCGLGVTGLWLYREFWRNFIRLRWRASGRIFFSDLHKTVGLSSVGIQAGAPAPFRGRGPGRHAREPHGAIVSRVMRTMATQVTVPARKRPPDGVKELVQRLNHELKKH